MISIHAPVWGATYDEEHQVVIFDISIHAPVWGATNAEKNAKAQTKISIHAPVWEATAISYKIVPIFKEFQFTLLCGKRQYCDEDGISKFEISIHAPV